MDLNKLGVVNDLLIQFNEVQDKLDRLNSIIGTDRDDPKARMIADFLVSSTLYYSIYEQIKSEYMVLYNELKRRLEEI